MMGDPAVALASGGLDSTTLLALIRQEGRELNCLTVDYGQTHRLELDAARRAAQAFGARRHVVLRVDLAQFGGSALTGGLERPPARTLEEIAQGGIPSTYVPARNTVFLALALAWAEALGCRDIFIGVNALDYSGYPDCRPEFIQAFERMAALATKAGVEGGKGVGESGGADGERGKGRGESGGADGEAGVERGKAFRIHTPLIRMSKAEIIRAGLGLGVDYSLTHSCYFPTAAGLACGRCDSCLLRLKGFAEAGAKDPLRYAG